MENLRVASTNEGNGDGHVHFRTEEVARHDAEISIVCPEEGIQEVHLGFLQIRHVYDVTFSIVDDLGEEVNFDPLENLVVKVKSIVPNADGKGHHLVVEFNAHKEKLMKEKVTIRSKERPDDVVFLIFFARVLGKFKGTPSLKNGVHCVRIDSDDEEESDWQGFN